MKVVTCKLTHAYTGPSNITVYGKEDDPVQVERHPALNSRGTIVVETGNCSVHFRPTPAEMRSLATALIGAADEIEGVAA